MSYRGSAQMMMYAEESILFFFNDTATTEIYTLSLHDALPIWILRDDAEVDAAAVALGGEPVDERQVVPGEDTGLWQEDDAAVRSEEHTSELQSHSDLVCRLLLEKKKKSQKIKSPDIAHAMACR